MTPEDLQEVTRRLDQEALLHSHGFEPVLEGGRELWARDDELFTRSRALVAALHEEVTELRRGR